MCINNIFKVQTIRIIGIQSTTLVLAVGTPRVISGVLEEYPFSTFSTQYFYDCFFEPALVYISFLFILHAIFGIVCPLGRIGYLLHIEGAENEEKETIVGQLLITVKSFS